MDPGSTPEDVMRHRIGSDTAADYLREAKHFFAYYDSLENELDDDCKILKEHTGDCGTIGEREINFEVWNALLESKRANDTCCSSVVFTEEDALLAEEARRNVSFQKSKVTHFSAGPRE